MPDIEWLRFITQIAYLCTAVVSVSLFLLIASFRGKNLVDWLLMFRDLLIATMCVRFFMLDMYGMKMGVEFRFTQWILMTLVCLTLFIALVREHVVYRKRILTHDE